MKRILVKVACGLLVLTSKSLFAQFDDPTLLEDLVFTSATGTARNLKDVPAVVTLITSDDIKKMGARELDEVLERVPGFHVARTPISTNPSYVVRGNPATFFNQRTLIMIDGIPIVHLTFNNRGTTWGGMPLNMVERIEVVRGPGSAVYGADAFMGTINIITKQYETAVNEFGARGGSNNTQEVWGIARRAFGDFESVFGLELTRSDGNSGTVSADSATTPENNVSFAPGPLNREYESVESRLSLVNNRWQFRAGYQGRFNVGTGAGHADALDPKGEQNTRRINSDLTYSYESDDQLLNLAAQLSFLDVKEDVRLQLFPEGFFGVEDGFIGEPFYRERHTRLELTSLYYGFTDHTLRGGVGAFRGKLFDTAERKNFNSNFMPLPETVDADASLIFILEQDRDINYAYLQDEWLVAPDWTMTAGIRFDHYSDFGNTTNGRFALVWQPRYSFTAKFLAGTAFRPPSLADLYLINNPVSNGNPDLKPEEITTFELAMTYQLSSALSVDFNIFRNELENLIESVPAEGSTTLIAGNAGEQTSIGFETEARWQISQNWRLLVNASRNRNKDERIDRDLGNAPEFEAYLSSELQFGRMFWSTSLYHDGEQERSPGDMRDVISSQNRVDTHIRYENDGGLDIGFVARNIFDEDIRYPASPSIPEDLPGPQRAMELYLRYAF